MKKMKVACVVGCMAVLMAGCKASAESAESKDTLQFVSRSGTTVVYFDRATGVEYIGLENQSARDYTITSLAVRLNRDGKPVIHK
ncbi:MAG: hypothetical protein E7572_07170 [Ruminococcaceae bacterium]|nr:hypothetical protein [Oscillospiraceae bacterium]